MYLRHRAAGQIRKVRTKYLAQLVVWNLDRLARSTRDLLNTLAAIADKKAGLCLLRGPRGGAPGKSASQPSRGPAWPVWSPAAQRRGATNNGLHQYLHSVFPTAKGNGLFCWF
jgi:hypothetical protein